MTSTSFILFDEETKELPSTNSEEQKQEEQQVQETTTTLDTSMEYQQSVLKQLDNIYTTNIVLVIMIGALLGSILARELFKKL